MSSDDAGADGPGGPPPAARDDLDESVDCSPAVRLHGGQPFDGDVTLPIDDDEPSPVDAEKLPLSPPAAGPSALAASSSSNPEAPALPAVSVPAPAPAAEPIRINVGGASSPDEEEPAPAAAAEAAAPATPVPAAARPKKAVTIAEDQRPASAAPSRDRALTTGEPPAASVATSGGVSNSQAISASGKRRGGPRRRKLFVNDAKQTDNAQRQAAHASGGDIPPTFASNFIKTSKYTWWSFLPLNLFEQFRRIANLYFLVIIILQLIPGVSPFPIYTSIIPLVIILAVTAAKEAREDYKRHQADEQANSRTYLVLRERGDIVADYMGAAKARGVAVTERDIVARLPRPPRSKARNGDHASVSMRPSVGAAPLVTGELDSLPGGRAGGLARRVSASGLSASTLVRAKATADEHSLRQDGVQWWRRVASRDIRVGDVVRIYEGEEFPADIALLSSASPDGLAFVNTANLDGEAVPKPKSAPAATLAMTAPHALVHLRAAVTAEAPSSNMHEWKGALAVAPAALDAGEPALPAAATAGGHTDSEGRFMHSLSQKQLMLRGSSLANTAYVNAVVVYTGPETRMMLNRNLARFKFSRFERKLNTFIVAIMGINLVCCLLMPSVMLVQDNKWEEWIGLRETGFVGWLLSFFTHYVLFSWMVPISLYVTIELVKMGQAQFMEWDEKLTWADPSSPPGSAPKTMKANSSALNEELGFIDYVFTDKTGTLTQNKMELAYVSVAGSLFRDVPERLAGEQDSAGAGAGAGAGAVSEEIATGAGAGAGAGDVLPTVRALAESITASMPFPYLTETGKFRAPDAAPTPAEASSLYSAAAREGFTADRVRERQLLFAYNMLLNNGVQPVWDAAQHKYQFQSQSPDEIALCEAFYRAGVMLLRRMGDHLEILSLATGSGAPAAGAGAGGVDVAVVDPAAAPRDGNENDDDDDDDDGAGDKKAEVMIDPAAVLSFTVLAQLEFTSARRRSDVIVRCEATGSLYLLVKGADSTLFPMCDNATPQGAALLARSDAQAAVFASTGSRTLVLAGRTLPQAEFEAWAQVYAEANTSLKDREALVEAAFARLESGLDLLGVSAVNDQMQEQVPETIDALLAAGVKVVVLTGDKRETAETISAECHILKPAEMRKLYVSSTPHLGDVREFLRRQQQLPHSDSNSNVGAPTPLNAQQRALREQMLRDIDSQGDSGGSGSPAGQVNARPHRAKSSHDEFDDDDSLLAAMLAALTPDELAEVRAEACRQSLHACLAHVSAALRSDADAREAVKRGIAGRPSDAHLTEAEARAVAAFVAREAETVRAINAGKAATGLATVAPTAGAAAGASAGAGGSEVELVPCADSALVGADSEEPLPRQFVALLSGNTLETALLHCKDDFLSLFLSCATIVTYRSAPKQKALVVELVARELGHTCLAIGDGANDVSMIQEAHVGVGILGKEGSHAAMSADYVLHRFAHLRRLLFVHGRYCLTRTSKVVMHCLYKNFVFVLPAVWFSFSNAFSGQVITSSYFMSLYNLIFTSLPPLVMGIWERDVHEDVLLKVPVAYAKSKAESKYTLTELARWIICAAAQSVVVYAFTFYSMMKPEIREDDGKTWDLLAAGNVLCGAVVVLVNFVMVADIDTLTWLNLAAGVIGILLFLVAYLFLSVIFWDGLSPETYGVFVETVGYAAPWLTLISTVGGMLMLWGAWKTSVRYYAPYFYQLLQAIDVSEATGAGAGAVKEFASAAAAADKPATPAATAGTARGEQHV